MKLNTHISCYQLLDIGKSSEMGMEEALYSSTFWQKLGGGVSFTYSHQTR